MQEGESTLTEEEFNYLLQLLLTPDSPRSPLDHGIFDEPGTEQADHPSHGGTIQTYS